MYHPVRRVCYALMETRAAQAAYEALHEKRPFHDGTFGSWAEKWSPAHPYRYDDGVQIWAAEQDLAPWDQFTTQVNASPVRSVAEESPGEQD